MLKDFIIASTLTIIFSVGVGVLFVQTVYELFQLFVRDNKTQESNKMPISLK